MESKAVPEDKKETPSTPEPKVKPGLQFSTSEQYWKWNKGGLGY